MPARAAARISASSGISRAGASGKSVSRPKWMRESRLPSASTSRCATSSSASATLESSVGTTTSVRASPGMPAARSRRGNRRGGANQDTSRCTKAIARSLAGTRSSSATTISTATRAPAAPA